jgi:hypothetical protein
VKQAVRELASEAGLQRGKQIELAAVVAAVVRAAERHDAVGMVAADPIRVAGREPVGHNER